MGFVNQESVLKLDHLSTENQLWCDLKLSIKGNGKCPFYKQWFDKNVTNKLAISLS